MNARTLSLATLLAASAALAQAAVPATPLGSPVPGLSPTELALFLDGKNAYEHAYTPVEGLGPLFNAQSCATCHGSPVTGGSESGTANNVTHFMLNPAGGNYELALEFGGPVRQRHSIAELPEGLGCGMAGETVPSFPGITTSLRHTPPVFGFGLLDAVPDEELVEFQGAKPFKRPGVLGVANYAIELESLSFLQAFSFDPTRTQPYGAARVGRFGWKAQVGTLWQFTTEPFNIELGVSTPFFPRENTPNGGPVPAGCQLAASPKPNDVGSGQSLRLFFFQALLAPPARLPKSASAERGEALFHRAGCDDCHRPVLRTARDYYLPLPDGTVHRVDALSGKRIEPFSDLLLHDMGPGLRDGRIMGRGGPQTWRTTPLWGIRFKNRYLHDGSALTEDDAIVRHGGEGQSSTDAYNALGAREKQSIVDFLETL